MGEILLTHPLVILHVLYVVILLPVAIWSDTPEPTGRKATTAPAEALGARGCSCPGTRLRLPATTAYHPRKEEKP
jgi:hypothetical protein